MEKKSNISQIIIIILLSITIILGGFLAYKQYIAKDDNKPVCNCEKCQDSKEKTFDGTKSLNTSKNYELLNNTTKYNNVASSLSSDKKVADISIDLSRYQAINVLTSNLFNDTTEVNLKTAAFSKKINSIAVGSSDQSFGYETIFYVLEDGSLYYSYVLKTVNNLTSVNNATISTTAISNMSDIERVVPALVKDSEFSTSTYLAIRNDGSFYDLSEIINKAF